MATLYSLSLCITEDDLKQVIENHSAFNPWPGYVFTGKLRAETVVCKFYGLWLVRPEKNNCLFPVSMNNFEQGRSVEFFFFFHLKCFHQLGNIHSVRYLKCILRHCLTKITITLLKIVRFSIQKKFCNLWSVC